MFKSFAISFISKIMLHSYMGRNKLILSGTIVRGLGEGTYFMSMKHYKNEIRKKLGFDAYPGTLNLRVSINKINLFKKINPIKIDGFKNNNKIFGAASCYKAKIQGISGSIIIPELTKHKNIIEFIAPIHLKSELTLKDRERVKIELL